MVKFPYNKTMKLKSLSIAGFTLIEMIVSLALFSVVVTISVGALLVLIASNEQLQSEQAVLTNLSFALDSMTREIRTGTKYYCVNEASDSSGGPNNIFANGNDLDGLLRSGGVPLVQDCPTGLTNNGHRVQGVAFIEGGDSVSGSNERIVYFFNKDTGKLYRRVGTENAQSIVSSGIFIKDAEFYVTGSEPLRGNPGENDQPSVTIYIEATATSTSAKSYQIQTTVTQRALDI